MRTGVIVDLIITKLVEKKLPEPYNNCVESYQYSLNPFINETMISNFLRPNTTYRQLNCLQLCSLTGGNKQNCVKFCPLECETTSYMTKVDAIKYNPSSYRYKVSKEIISRYNDLSNMTDDEIKARLLNLYVFIENLSHQEISQISKVTVPDFLSNVGGTFGLFMGISMITFVELLEFIWMLIHADK